MIVILATGAFAVAAQPSAQQPQQSQQQQQMQDPQRTHALHLERGFIKQGDRIFRVDRVTKSTELEGLKIDDQGHVMTKDGKRIELKDGQLVTPEGKIENFEQGKQ